MQTPADGHTPEPNYPRKPRRDRSTWLGFSLKFVASQLIAAGIRWIIENLDLSRHLTADTCPSYAGPRCHLVGAAGHRTLLILCPLRTRWH